jgi:hypothetical protein
MELNRLTIGQAHLQFAQANAKAKNCKRACPSNQEKENNETPTSCIVHLADSADFKGSTFNKFCSGLTGSCPETPNDTIHVTVVRHSMDDRATIKQTYKNYKNKH